MSHRTFKTIRIDSIVDDLLQKRKPHNFSSYNDILHSLLEGGQ